jgi:hypothetical protein
LIQRNRHFYHGDNNFSPLCRILYFGENVKIVGIGLSRTGESSLTEALVMLGYRVHFVLAHENVEEALKSPRFDAFTHTPLACCYKEIDRQYPDSKFILTTRERESWLQSCEKRWATYHTPPQFATAYNDVNRRLYGIEDFDRDTFSKAYDKHLADILQHFAGREQQLLLLNICAGEGFEKLCPFLGKPVLAQPFPQKNSMAEFQSPLKRIMRLLSRFPLITRLKRFLLGGSTQ